MRRMSGVDAAMWYAETPDWLMHVGGLAVARPADPEFSFDRVRDLVVERLPLLPQLRCKVVELPFGIDRPWLVEDDHLDPDFHIRRVGVPPPGTRRELEDLVGRLMSYRLDRSRPPWELWLIDGLAGNRVAALTKVHHALVDGVSGVALGEVLFDRDPVAAPAALAPPPSPVAAPTPLPARPLRLLSGAVNVGVRTPWRMTEFLAQTLRQQVAVLGLPDRPPHFFEAPLTRFNAHVSAYRRVSGARVDLDRVRAVKQAYDVKLNDVVLALVAGAVRGYLAERDELPVKPLVAQIPVSTRATNRAGESANRLVSMTVGIATDVEDTVERVLAISRATRGAKQMAQEFAVRQVLGLTDMAPPGLLHLAARTYTASGLSRRLAPINLVVSDVPGPAHPLYLAGAEVESMMPMGPPVLDVGLNVTALSYLGHLDFGFVSTVEIAPDLDALADAVEQALREIERAAGLGDRPAPPPGVPAPRRSPRRTPSGRRKAGTVGHPGEQ